MEFDPYGIEAVTHTSDLMQYLDFFIALVTCIFCFIGSATYFYWWYSLWYSKAELKVHFLGVAVFMFGVAIQSLSNIFNIVIYDADLPNITFIPRVIVMFGTLFKIYSTTRLTPSSHSKPLFVKEDQLTKIE